MEAVDDGMMEWTGLLKASKTEVAWDGYWHVYELVSKIPFCRLVKIRCVEIDYIEEIAAAEKWLNKYKNAFFQGGTI